MVQQYPEKKSLPHNDIAESVMPIGYEWLRTERPAEAADVAFADWVVDLLYGSKWQKMTQEQAGKIITAAQKILRCGLENGADMDFFTSNASARIVRSLLTEPGIRQHLLSDLTDDPETDQWILDLNECSSEILHSFIVGAISPDDRLYLKVAPYLQDMMKIEGAESFSLQDSLTELLEMEASLCIDIASNWGREAEPLYTHVLRRLGVEAPYIRELWRQMANDGAQASVFTMARYTRGMMVLESMCGQGSVAAAVNTFGLLNLPCMDIDAARRMMALARCDETELDKLRVAYRCKAIRFVGSYHVFDHNGAYDDGGSLHYEAVEDGFYTLYAALTNTTSPREMADFIVNNYGVNVAKWVINTHGLPFSMNVGAEYMQTKLSGDGSLSAGEQEYYSRRAAIGLERYIGWLAHHACVDEGSVLILGSCHSDTLAPIAALVTRLRTVGARGRTALVHSDDKGLHFTSGANHYRPGGVSRVAVAADL